MAIIKNGNNWFIRAHPIEGGWAVEEKDGNYFFSLDDVFQTDPGPDVKIFLSPFSDSEIDIRTPIHKKGVLVERVQSYSGAQRYALPTDDLSKFKTVVLHCEIYSAVWGGVEL